MRIWTPPPLPPTGHNRSKLQYNTVDISLIVPQLFSGSSDCSGLFVEGSSPTLQVPQGQPLVRVPWEFHSRAFFLMAVSSFLRVWRPTAISIFFSGPPGSALSCQDFPTSCFGSEDSYDGSQTPIHEHLGLWCALEVNPQSFTGIQVVSYWLRNIIGPLIWFRTSKPQQIPFHNFVPPLSVLTYTSLISRRV